MGGPALLGRTAALREVREALEWEGAVQLVGPPGIGKTALARALGPDAVVELEGVVARDELLSRVAAAVESPDREAAVLEAAGERTLLLLDGAEGLDGDAVAWVERLRERVAVLATSRRRLAGLPTLELGPLDAEAGEALLRARVGAATRARSLDGPALRALVERLDGVPLALELVAPRLRLREPEDLLEGSAEGLLAGTDGAERLLVALRTGLAGLSAGARQVVEAAAILPVAVDVRLLEEMFGRSVDGAVIELLDAGLLTREEGAPPRVRVLAPVRAAVDPASGRSAWIAALARGVLGPAELAVDDLEGALHTRPLRRLVDARPLLERILETDDPDTWLRAARALAALERRAGPQRRTVTRDGARPAGGDRALRVGWAMDVAAAASHLGQPELGRAVLERVEGELEGDRSRWEALVATVLADAGDVEAARARILPLADSADPVIAFRVGAVRFRAGDLAGAVADFRRARDGATGFRRLQATNALCICLRETGHPPELVLAELADLGVDLGDPDLAWLAPRLRAIEGVLLADAGELEAGGAVLADTAEALWRLGEPDDAIGQWLTARLLAVAAGGAPSALLEPVDGVSPRTRPHVDLHRALGLALSGRPEAAVQLAEAALDGLRQGQDRRLAELGALWAVVAPEGGLALLDTLSDDPLVELARSRLRGQLTGPRARLEDRVLAALADRMVDRVRVRRDGGVALLAGGERIDIRRRRVLRQVLLALVEADGPLHVDGICARVWPGERLVGDSGTRRVHVAISTLRGLGLREAIHTVTLAGGETGWALDAEVVDAL